MRSIRGLQVFLANTFIAGPPEFVPDARLVPAPYRGRGRATHYSEELVEEFCGLIVDGMTVRIACQQTGMPGRSTIYEWLARYPEFRREYEAAVLFRNQCWMDDCVDIAEGPQPDGTGSRETRINARWRQITGAGLKAGAQPHPSDTARDVNGQPEQIIEHDPVYRHLRAWELEAQRRRG